MSHMDRLCAKIQSLQDQAQNIRDKAEIENRDFTPDETETLDGILADLDRFSADKDRLEKLEAQKVAAAARPGRQTEPNQPVRNDVRITPVQSTYDRNRWSFDTMGDYLRAVIVSSGKGHPVDQRLLANAPTTVGTEGAGPDGGFAVPPDYRSAIQDLILGEESLLARTDQQVSSSNTFTIPTDETTPWQTSGGILAYWVGEQSQMTESKPSFKEVVVKLHKLTVMVPVTEELMEDAPALEAYIPRKAGEKINFEVNRCIVQGTGAGQPLGILNSSSLVEVAAEGSQTADTVNFANIVKMWSRCYGPRRNRAVWLINQDVEPQLLSLVATSAYQTAYMPPGGLSGAPYSTLFGRPVIPTQACETLGDKGDIILADLSSYLTVSRSLRSDMSIHLYFDYDVTCFRFVLRLAGQPWWSTTISARDGSNTYSPFVTLAERAG